VLSACITGSVRARMKDGSWHAPLSRGWQLPLRPLRPLDSAQSQLTEGPQAPGFRSLPLWHSGTLRRNPAHCTQRHDMARRLWGDPAEAACALKP
jgi:hypothetical protein